MGKIHSENNDQSEKKLKKKKNKTQKNETTETVPEEIESNLPNDNEIVSNEIKSEEKESKRAIKRKKHANLIEQKKLKALAELQSKTLNYLSRWKYNNNEWKFEKLRQVWLQKNLFDSTLIPEESWEIVVEYFKGSKGRGRQEVLDEAVKIIDSSESLGDDEFNRIKIQRARDIVQILQ